MYAPDKNLFRKNIKNFQNELCNINWEPLYDTDDVNQGYNYLDTKIKQSYLSNFKLVKLSRNRAEDKIWITPGLKRSSKHKNKLYKKLLKSKLPSDEEKYKTCRRLYKQLLKETNKYVTEICLILELTLLSSFGIT